MKGTSLLVFVPSSTSPKLDDPQVGGQRRHGFVPKSAKSKTHGKLFRESIRRRDGGEVESRPDNLHVECARPCKSIESAFRCVSTKTEATILAYYTLVSKKSNMDMTVLSTGPLRIPKPIILIIDGVRSSSQVHSQSRLVGNLAMNLGLCIMTSADAVDLLRISRRPQIRFALHEAVCQYCIAEL